MTSPEPSRYDSDPEALAWARTKVEERLDRVDQMVAAWRPRATSDPATTARFTGSGNAVKYLRSTLIDGGDHGIAAFDTRRAAVEGARPARAIDWQAVHRAATDQAGDDPTLMACAMVVAGKWGVPYPEGDGDVRIVADPRTVVQVVLNALLGATHRTSVPAQPDQEN